jgi:hypothetical protein
MAFKFEGKLKKPAEYGGSPSQAVLDEARQFTKARRAHGFRRLLGLEQEDEAELPAEAQEAGAEEAPPGEYTPGSCEACEAGTCDDPAHMGDDEKEAMAGLKIIIKPKG